MPPTIDIEWERRRNRWIAEGLEIPREQRLAWAESLGLDGTLSPTELLALIEEAEAMDDFLEQPAIAATPTPSLGPPAISGFEVGALLGEGGMGSVYFAEQTTPVRRKVAIKVVRPTLASNETALARFDSERQALASCKHPNIASLLEAGRTEDGRPFFAMEWIDGPPITQYCDHHQLDIDQRVLLFVDVCRGVQHANERQILHRDLKPENILVAEPETERESGPQPKIIDFGIAKDLAHTHGTLTKHGLLGTPEYITPEAIAGHGDQLDTRSEVYALGVLLQELICGVGPFQRHDTNIAAFLRQVEEGRPLGPSEAFRSATVDRQVAIAAARRATPSQLEAQLRGDLNWIALKAIRREPGERYSSAAALGSDVERALTHEPVEAAPPSTWYTTKKFVQRNKLAVAAAAALLLALVGGVLGTSIGLVRAQNEAATAQQALAETEETASFFNELFLEADPRRAQGKEITARQMLDLGAERIQERFEDQPLARARVMRTIGDIYTQLNLPSEAKPLLEGAVNILESEVAENDADSNLLADGYHSLAVLAYAQDEFETAADLYRRAIDASSAAEPIHEARMRHNLGIALYRSGLEEEALAAYEQGLRIRRAALPADHADIANSLSAIGVLQMFRSDPAAAGNLEEALAIRVAALGDDHPYVAASLTNLCLLYRRRAEFEKAESPCRRGVELERRNYGDSHTSTSRAIGNYASWYAEQGRIVEARPLFWEALEIQERATGKLSPSYAGRLNVVLNAFWMSGRYGETLELAEENFQIQSELREPNHPTLVLAGAKKGLPLWKLGHLDEAWDLLLRAKDVFDNGTLENPSQEGQILIALSGVLRDRVLSGEAEPGSLQEAQGLYDAGWSLIESSLAEGHEFRRWAEAEGDELRQAQKRHAGATADSNF